MGIKKRKIMIISHHKKLLCMACFLRWVNMSMFFFSLTLLALAPYAA